MKKENLTNAGAILAAFLAASCCVGPAVFVITGTSLGFLGRLSFMERFRPYLLSTAGLMLGYSFWKLYIKKRACDCAEDIRARKIARLILWIGFAALVIAASFQNIVSLIYG
jgi:mercuric ion transport protein